MGEIKQTNFRIDGETADKFRAFCNEMGMNQAQGFDHIMQVVEIDRSKSVISSRATEIEDMERHIKAITEGYLRSLQIAEETEQRVEERYRSQINEIKKLREKADEAEKRAANNSDAARRAQHERDEAEKTIETLTTINNDLKEKCKSMESKVNSYNKLATKYDQLKVNWEQMKATLVKKYEEKFKDEIRKYEREIGNLEATIKLQEKSN